MPARAVGRIEVLDVLRGIAAVWVMVFHFSFGVHDATVAPFVTDLQGLLPVYLFFMISGFVILMTLERCANLADFCVARFARLYPSFWICLAIAAAAAALWPLPRQPVSLPQVLANASMLEDFLGFGQVDPAYWSLTNELVFYGLAAMAFALGWLNRMEHLGALWLALSVLAFDLFPQVLDHVPWRLKVASGLEFAPLFLAGILIFRMRQGGVRLARLALYGACYLGFVWHRSWIEVAAIGAFFVILPLSLLRFHALGRHPLLLFLSAISYPLYLVHQTLGIRIQIACVHAGLSRWGSFAVAIAVCIALAALISRTIERPAQRAIRRAWIARRGRAGSPSVPAV
jgi:peptidoglycan/LPS O-acetylase OafA/YrhL